MRLRHIALLAVVLPVGCGDAERSPKPAPTAPPGRAAASPSPAPRAGRPTVTIADFAYVPRTLQVAAGTKVTWTNRDTANHTVTFAKGPGDLGNIDPGRRVSARFARAGRYAYLCQYHPSMHGVIAVR